MGMPGEWQTRDAKKSGGICSARRDMRHDIRLTSIALDYRKIHYWRTSDGELFTYITAIVDYEGEFCRYLHELARTQKWFAFGERESNWYIDRGPFGTGVGYRYKIAKVQVFLHQDEYVRSLFG